MPVRHRLSIDEPDENIHRPLHDPFIRNSHRCEVIGHPCGTLEVIEANHCHIVRHSQAHRPNSVDRPIGTMVMSGEESCRRIGVFKELNGSLPPPAIGHFSTRDEEPISARSDSAHPFDKGSFCRMTDRGPSTRPDESDLPVAPGPEVVDGQLGSLPMVGVDAEEHRRLGIRMPRAQREHDRLAHFLNELGKIGCSICRAEQYSVNCREDIPRSVAHTSTGRVRFEDDNSVSALEELVMGNIRHEPERRLRELFDDERDSPGSALQKSSSRVVGNVPKRLRCGSNSLRDLRTHTRLAAKNARHRRLRCSSGERNILGIRHNARILSKPNRPRN